jgi:hypothetical protein
MSAFSVGLRPVRNVDENGAMSGPAAALIAFLAVVAIVVVVRFEVFCLRELARADDYQLLHLTRRGWTVAILFSIPFGGMAYLLFGRAR